MTSANPPGQTTFVDLGTRRLFARCAGRGSPTIILEGGLGSTHETWALVQPHLAAWARVCSYDRAGLGQSDPAPTPRTCQDLVNDLQALLTGLGWAPPYVLVGHSLGGLIVRLYAAQYPAAVAGLVLIDATHEDRQAHFENVLSPALMARNRAYLHDPTRNAEQLDVLTSAAQVRAARQAFTFPLRVLARGLPDAPSAIWPTAALQRIEVELQRALTHRAPQGVFTLAEKSGHFIQQDEPQLVIDAIRQVVDAARCPVV